MKRQHVRLIKEGVAPDKQEGTGRRVHFPMTRNHRNRDNNMLMSMKKACLVFLGLLFLAKGFHTMTSGASKTL
jgi:hypothetical protein